MAAALCKSTGSGAARAKKLAEALQLRDSLITRYRPYVLKLARVVAESVPIHVELDDLIGWGHWGLVEAASRFDPRRGVAFRSYAHRRIIGSMYDGLRREHSVSTRLELPSDEVLYRIADGGRVTVADGSYAHEILTFRPAAVRFGPNGSRQDHDLWLAEVRKRLSDAMARLTPVERAIIKQRYFNDKPVEKLCRRTRYSKSWLSRLHGRALSRLRDDLEDLNPANGVHQP